jgi:hypothetical protein
MFLCHEVTKAQRKNKKIIFCLIPHPYKRILTTKHAIKFEHREHKAPHATHFNFSYVPQFSPNRILNHKVHIDTENKDYYLP